MCRQLLARSHDLVRQQPLISPRDQTTTVSHSPYSPPRGTRGRTTSAAVHAATDGVSSGHAGRDATPDSFRELSTRYAEDRDADGQYSGYPPGYTADSAPRNPTQTNRTKLTVHKVRLLTAHADIGLAERTNENTEGTRAHTAVMSKEMFAQEERHADRSKGNHSVIAAAVAQRVISTDFRPSVRHLTSSRHRTQMTTLAIRQWHRRNKIHAFYNR